MRTPAAISATRRSSSASRSSSADDKPALAAGLEVAGVGLEDLRGALDQRGGDRLERRVLDARSRASRAAREARFAAAQVSATDVVVVAIALRLREHEVVPVHGLFARTRNQLADIRGLHPAHPPQLGRRSSCRCPCRPTRRRARSRPRRRRRRTPTRRRRRPAAGSYRPHAALVPRRRRRPRGRAPAWRTSATA